MVERVQRVRAAGIVGLFLVNLLSGRLALDVQRAVELNVQHGEAPGLVRQLSEQTLQVQRRGEIARGLSCGDESQLQLGGEMDLGLPSDNTGRKSIATDSCVA